MRNCMNKPIAATIVLSLGLSLAACAGGAGSVAENRSLESVNQPVVSQSNFTLDLVSGSGGLSIPEQRRLAGWFEAMDLRYGDRIAIDDPLTSPTTLRAVSAIAERYGILVSEGAPVTPGYVDPGKVRIVITRASAEVPDCPNWSAKKASNLGNQTSPGYGCAINSNLAAMVANPEHLIHGAKGTGDTTIVMSSNKAIDSYRKAQPTGEKGLKTNSTDGGSN